MIAALLSLAALASAIATPAPGIPNPVSIFYSGRGPVKTYAVDCWSGPGERGTWFGVTGSTYTQQEALVYTPLPTAPSEQMPKPSVLYCFGTDGKPGIIQGAPQGFVLPAGTRVESYPTAEIMMKRRVNGKTDMFGVSIPILDSTVLTSGPDGVTVRNSAHDMTIYPPGTFVMIEAGTSVGYYRPGTTLHESTQATASGCTVTTIGANGASSTSHFDRDCSSVQVGEK